jgi:hypothetical protein
VNAKDRHPLLNSVPPQVEEFLLEPPLAGTGVHQWFYKAARRTCRYLEETDQNELLAWAVRNCGRSPGPQEIEKTVHKVRTQYDAGLEFTGGSAWPEPNYEFVNQLVSGGPTIAEVRNASPVWPLSDDPLYWLNILFAQGNPLLCLAKEVWKDTGTGREVVRYWSTRSKAAWNKQGCPTHGLIIPNIACSYSGLSQEGKRSRRCAAMFPERSYLVVELDFSIYSRDGTKETPWAPYIRQWEARRRTVQDACAAVLWHLRSFGPLALIVWSGGKSLHAWFGAAGVPQDKLYPFMRDAVALGADPATWSTCQLVRLPAGVRTINGNLQQVEFFDPDQL